MKAGKLITASIGIMFCMSAGAETQNNTDHNWLSEASELQRYERLEYYLGGFSQVMQEVGHRYKHVEQAILDENYELAGYHWDKIEDAINRGILKRPTRGDNARTIFLNDAWFDLADALAEAVIADDPSHQDVRNGFLSARGACQACHTAENVSFINNQPLFTESELDR